MQLSILNIEGKDTGRSTTLPDDIFQVEDNDHILYLAVKQHLANKRQGTHDSRERSFVAGSTKKLKRQKGTGTARAGDIKSPLFRGGGRVFGPRPRSYDQKLNKKVKQQARKVALSQKVKNGELIIVEDFTFDGPKTKQFVQVMQALNTADKKHLLVLGEHDNNVYLSGRNVRNGGVAVASNLSTYDILNAGTLVLSEGAVTAITEQLKNTKS